MLNIYLNMIPVPEECLTQVKYNEIEKFRTFRSEKEKKIIYICCRKKNIL